MRYQFKDHEMYFWGVDLPGLVLYFLFIQKHIPLMISESQIAIVFAEVDFSEENVNIIK